ncbi:MAG TPA: hypothetical protein VI968_01195 [archaeon]|nr:hypothetical protein [archaeon]
MIGVEMHERTDAKGVGSKASFDCIVCGSLKVCQKCIAVGDNSFCVSLCREHISDNAPIPAIESGAYAL